MAPPDRDTAPRFDRSFFDSKQSLTRIGEGGLGGKALGLARIKSVLESALETERFPEIRVEVPTLTVVTTQMFDRFMEQNGLYELALSGTADERIAHAFQKADLPVELVGDLKALIDQVHSPLAVRSSSLLEDALYQPFAGVYGTKMIPNNQPEPDERFRKLVEAIKFVYASTFFQAARSYISATQETVENEKMAVVIQEVVGRRHGDRFYPDLSGVGRTFNFYPTGAARPEQGVVNLALGLGKTIVDGGISWVYSPAHPAAPPPFGSISELLKSTQLDYWAVNMGRPPEYNPIAETEYLVKDDLTRAEYDGTLRWVASTYNAASDRLTPGTGPQGPRVVTFAPLLVLRELPLNDVLTELLSICQSEVDAQVEIEFAVTIDRGPPIMARLGFLQVRPMVVSDELVEIAPEDMDERHVLAASDRAMGNGVIDSIRDIVYVKPDAFDAKFTGKIAYEIERSNSSLRSEGAPYLLMGFGRWGSSDPWLGIPVEWGQISGAKVIVEATLPAMNVDPSQGSHFFHNMTAFRVSYFSVHHSRRPGIDWEWLARQEALAETDFVRQVRLKEPLRIKVDGRTGRGVIKYNRAPVEDSN